MFFSNKRLHKGHDCGDGCTDEHHDHDLEKAVENFETMHIEVPKGRVIPKKKAQQLTFENFLNFFPQVELPYSIFTETQTILSVDNDPLAIRWMYEFVLAPDVVVDEFTEYMGCFSIPNTEKFFALVYWEACLEGSAYFLATFSKSGVLIDKQQIAGTKYTRKELIQSVCTIREDWTISVVMGRIDIETNQIDKENSMNEFVMQLTPEGQIIEID